MSLLLAFLFILGQTLSAQVRYELELQPDNETYLVSFVPDVSYPAPNNLVVSGQVTIRLPHGIGENSFQVADLTMETPGAIWAAADIVYAPMEAPHFDYFSFALNTPGTSVYDFQAGVPVPVFSFKNGAGHCADSLYIINNDSDPMLPFNSLGLNIGNSLVISGGGFTNLYSGYVGTGAAPGTPQTVCVDETIEDHIGCDSVIYEGATYTRDTILDIHFTSSVGCDSAFITRIFIQDDIASTVDTAICRGEVFNGIEIMQNETVMDALVNSNGCDSMVNYQVSVLEPSTNEEDVNVQIGDEVNGIAVFSDTTIIEILTNAEGCDSILTYNVRAFDDQPTIFDIDLCLGESYNGNYFLEDTTWVETLVNSVGLDSTIVTNIYVRETYYITVLADLCHGQPHTDGVVYDKDTSFVQSYQSVFGCDSIITTTIEVMIPEYFSKDTSICFGDLYNGELYESDQVFTESLTSISGCDSVVNQINLTVHPAIEAAIEGTDHLCQGEQSLLTATGGTAYLWGDGTTNDDLWIEEAGIYQVTVSDAFGCSTATDITVTSSIISAEVQTAQPLCSTGAVGSIQATNISGGVEPYLYSIDGGVIFSTEPNFPHLTAGQYDIVIEDDAGCQYTTAVEIDEFVEISVNAGDDQHIRLNETTSLRAETNLPAPDSVVWSPAAGLECPNCLLTEAKPLVTTTYTVTVFDENGCSAESQVTIKVNAEKYIYAPNAFSPNGDGFNDLFTVFAGEEVTQVVQLSVFDRWGGHVFSTENINPSDLTAGWDGFHRGNPAHEGLYIWMAELEFVDGKKKLFEGEVSLIR